MAEQVLKISTEFLNYIEYEYLDNESKDYKQIKLSEAKIKLEQAISEVSKAKFKIEWL